MGDHEAAAFACGQGTGESESDAMASPVAAVEDAVGLGEGDRTALILNIYGGASGDVANRDVDVALAMNDRVVNEDVEDLGDRCL